MLSDFFKKDKISARDASDIRRATAEKLYPIINEYVNWYCEKGLTLPEQFEQDPTTWTNILRKIQRSFYLTLKGNEIDGDIYNAIKNNDEEGVKSLLQQQQEGLELFGKHLLDLVDPLYKENAR